MQDVFYVNGVYVKTVYIAIEGLGQALGYTKGSFMRNSFQDLIFISAGGQVGHQLGIYMVYEHEHNVKRRFLFV